jgi:hypothetical protein
MGVGGVSWRCVSDGAACAPAKMLRESKVVATEMREKIAEDMATLLCLAR